MAYYGGNDEQGQDKHPEEAVYEACLLLNDEIDFSKYDNSGDDTVDLVFMYYAGYGEADGGDEDTIWPHQWELTSGGLNLDLDGKKVDRYACSNELQATGPLQDTMVGIGTACHEFGHAMGLPDFYDTDYETNGLAAGPFDFSLMAGGSYNNNGRTPPYFNIEERILLGWLDDSALTEITAAGNYTLASVHENKAYMTPTDLDGEYFVYECRDDSGWDAYLPSHGMLVYHVDKSSRKVNVQNYGQVLASELWSNWSVTNSINENGSHPCFYVVPAADQDNLMYGFEYLAEYGSYYFDPDNEGLVDNIPFPGAQNVTTYTPVSWNDVESPVSLKSIAYAGGQVSFTVTMPKAGLDFFSIRNPGGGVYQQGGSFALQLNEVEGLTYSGVKWYFDDAEVSGTSVTLSSTGSHTVEAVVTLTGGKTQTVTLEISVQ